MHCTLQIFLDDEWVDCAEIAFDGKLCQWNYFVDYAIDHPNDPVSLIEEVDTHIRQSGTLPAFVYDLVPQGAGRRFLLGELGLADNATADFPLTCAGAANPIGRLRIADARAYFDAHVARYPGVQELPGLTEADVSARGPEFAEQMLIHGMLGTGTTGVQGAAPKHLLTRDRQGLLHGDASLPDARATQHLIAKRARGNTAADAKVLCNEAPYMRVAAALGIRTHTDRPTLHGEVLLVPRFDRIVQDGKVIRLHQESVASILGLAGFDQRPTLFEVVSGLRRVVTDPAAETLEFLRRDVLNLAMRNTDNHARNTAVQVIDGRVQLTPLFDFAPMYLDPEGIARTLRWHHPETGAELTDWVQILALLPIPDHERDALRSELREFGAELERLPDLMATEGVDPDIIDFLKMSIDTQVHLLKNLQPEGNYHAPPTPPHA